MRLTKSTSHAIRILIDCAQADARLVKVAELSERLHLYWLATRPAGPISIAVSSSRFPLCDAIVRLIAPNQLIFA